MVSYIDTPYDIAFDIERGSQVASNFDGMNRLAINSRELVNLVWSQARIEGILLEDFERSGPQSFLFRSQFR